MISCVQIKKIEGGINLKSCAHAYVRASFPDYRTISGTKAMASRVVLEGWEAFFGETACFLHDCEGNEDTTDQRKLECICEHLENCITHIRILYAQIDQKKWLTVMMGFVS